MDKPFIVLHLHIFSSGPLKDPSVMSKRKLYDEVTYILNPEFVADSHIKGHVAMKLRELAKSLNARVERFHRELLRLPNAN